MLQFGHGIYAVETPRLAHHLASRSQALQFGHGIYAVETSIDCKTIPELNPLQFGHGIYAVETRISKFK